MPREHVPQEILDLAHRRREARAARDWPQADALRAEIAAAGWLVVDQGVDFELRPAHPPTQVDGGHVRYGTSSAVPSLLDEGSLLPATVVLVATEWPDDVERAIRGLRTHVPGLLQIVVVADGPSAAQQDALAALADDDVEVVETSERLGHGAALNVGLRRARGEVVVVMDASVEPTGDVVAPLRKALDDPSVGVAGGWGLRSADLRHFEERGAGEVEAIEGYALAFRRADGAARGPFDEHFRFYRNLDIWWSLVLRDEGEGKPPRRAVAVDLPAVRHEHRAWAATDPAERDRLSRRNFYRILDRFRDRPDLASAEPSASRPR